MVLAETIIIAKADSNCCTETTVVQNNVSVLCSNNVWHHKIACVKAQSFSLDTGPESFSPLLVDKCLFCS